MKTEKIEEIKKYFSDNGVWFATNSIRTDEGSLFEKSYNLYNSLIDENKDNFMLVNGTNCNYGYFCFLDLIYKCMFDFNHKDVRHIIYIDEDCFISDIEVLYELVKDFISSEKAFAGVPDGGVVCHRNHNHIAINTFFTLFNIDIIKKLINCQNINLFQSEIYPQIESCSFEKFSSRLSYNKLSLLINDSKVCAAYSEILKVSLDIKEIKYCDTVRNDVDNPIEHNQIPYSYKLDNFEPYYKLFFYLMSLGAEPYYIPGTDIWKVNNEEVDNMGGICSALYFNMKPFCYHTWFARAYSSEPEKSNDPLIVKHTNRINQIYDWVLKNKK